MHDPIFPMTLTSISHRYGGTIAKVHGIRHRECRPAEGRSRDYGFFECDVQWNDGHLGTDVEVEPFKLCCDDPPNNAEMRALNEAMNAYLREHGVWCEAGEHQGWYAHRKASA